MDNSKPSYSQCGEDRILAFLFKVLKIDKPFYIDIGAYDPYKDNNTAIFYENGASGINVEPNIDNYKRIVEKRERDVNLNLGISDKGGKQRFYKLSSDQMNTLLKENANGLVNSQGMAIEEVIEIETITFNELMERCCNGVNIDLLTLDTEGMDLRILKSIDWDKYAPLIICVESASYSRSGEEEKDEELIQFLESKGYLNYADTRINNIFVDKSRYVGHG